ncbi:MAG: EAL domain-containing protein [Actinobacteria bacterium]|nr:EAL domain-containing protein [Actinomycetota bacterium]
MPATDTPDEALRLADLKSLEILDTPSELEFDYLVEAASLIANTPVALFSLIDADRQWFKARVGLEVPEGTRSESFCGHAIQPPHDPLIVSDSTKDERFADNPWTTGDPPVIFYAGFPVVTERNHAVGTLCVIDNVPRTLTDSQIEAISSLARQAAAMLELRREKMMLASELAQANASQLRNELWNQEHDATTGLATRDVIEARIDTLDQGGGGATASSVICIKLPRFGETVRAMGQRDGDAVLRAVADRVSACLPAETLLARTAQTSFAALLLGDQSEASTEFAERIRDALSSPIAEAGKDAASVLNAIGIARFSQSGFRHADMLRAAEVAALDASAIGRGAIVEADEATATQREDLSREIRMQTALIDAIDRGQVTVVYQPIVDLASDEVVGSEALARWQDPELGVVDAATFVRLAERSGVVAALDALVLEQALEDLSRGLSGGPSLSVNLSPAGVFEETPQKIAAALERWNVEPQLITLELTERSGLNENRRLVPILETIAASGVRISLDDFGVGETSIAHLRELPISQLKLDGSLVVGLDGADRARARAVVTSIAILARSLEIEAVAEGIETQPQKAAVLAAGIKRGQGFLFGSPMPAGVIEATALEATSGVATSAAQPRSQASVSTDFFENTPDLTAIADGDKFVRVNSRWHELLGWSEEQMLGSSFIDLIHPDDRAMTLEQVARLARGEAVVAFENRYATAAGGFKVLRWSAHLDRSSGLAVASAHDITAEHEAEVKRRQLAHVLEVLAELQNRYLAEGLTRSWWEFALAQFLKLTESSFGFIGRVELDENDATYLVTYAVTNIAWNEWSRQLHDEFEATGLEFHNHDTLFGVTLATGEAVISNDPENDPRAGGLPDGHPKLESYAGLPLLAADGLVGMVGLANRNNGFTSELFDDLAPLFVALSQIIALERSNQTIERATFATATTAAAIQAMRIAHDRQAALTSLIDATAKFNPEAQIDYFAVVGDSSQMEWVDPERGNPHSPECRSIHPQSCLALTTGEPHISRANGSAEGRCEHVGANENDVLCVDVKTAGEGFGVIVATVPAGPGKQVPSAADRFADQADELMPRLVSLAAGLAEHSLAHDIARRALADPLTGLANRTRFAQAISAALSRDDRRAEPFSVILVDLDRMKAINDRFGHPAGDAVLIDVGRAIAVTLRADDTLARFGGDEYAILLYECNREQLQKAGERIHSALSSISIAGDGTVSASLGGVVVSDNKLTWHEIYRAADSALYGAKNAGGNRLEIGGTVGL